MTEAPGRREGGGRPGRGGRDYKQAGRYGGSGRWPGIDESLKVIHPNVATVLAPLVPVFIRIQRNGKGERNLFYT